MAEDKGDVDVGMIIGVTATGAVVSAAIVALIAVCCCCRKRGYTMLRRLTSGRQVMVVDNDEECANRIDILPHMKIADIKSELSGSESLEVEKMRLLYHHEELRNDEDVDIALSRRRAKSAKIILQKLIKLIVEIEPDKSCELYASPQHDTLSSAEAIVASVLEIGHEFVKFGRSTNEETLDSNSTFEACGIKSDIKLSLMPICITAKVFSQEGKFDDEDWKCNPVSTVRHLLDKIQRTVDPDKQSLDIRRARRRYYNFPPKCDKDSASEDWQESGVQYWVNVDEIDEEKVHSYTHGVFIIEELVTINVNFPGEKVMHCKIHPYDRIKDLRENISKRKNIPVKFLQLCLQENDKECLDSSRFIFECRSDTLHVKPVVVELLSDVGLIHQECDPTGTVRDIRDILRGIEPRAVPITTHIAVKEFVEADDMKDWARRDMHEENVPLCFVRKVHVSHNKKIHAVFPSGYEEIINCHLTMTIGQLRQTIHERTRCPLDHLILASSNGQPMRDEAMVYDYRLLDGDSVVVEAIPVWITVDDERTEFYRDPLLTVEATADEVCSQRNAEVGCLEYFHEKQKLWRVADEKVRALPVHGFRELKIRTLRTQISELAQDYS